MILANFLYISLYILGKWWAQFFSLKLIINWIGGLRWIENRWVRVVKNIRGKNDSYGKNMERHQYGLAFFIDQKNIRTMTLFTVQQRLSIKHFGWFETYFAFEKKLFFHEIYLFCWLLWVSCVRKCCIIWSTSCNEPWQKAQFKFLGEAEDQKSINTIL